VHATLQARKGNEEDIQKAIIAAHDSFRGIGYHKTRALFGKDIYDLFEELNKSYSFLVSGLSNSDIGENLKHVSFVVETGTKLPEYFKDYIYFGNYKKDW
jgi:hypothetical protein